MKASSLLLALGFTLLTGGFLASCSSDETTNPPGDNEFVAQSSDFANYASWTKVVGPLHGPDPAGLLSEGAHSGNDSSIARSVFINNASATRGSNGEFPNGTILVKELKDSNGTTAVITAMAKRGGTFNSQHKGWEWFVIDPASGTIASRADTLMGGLCNSCHVVNADKDYVFTR